MELALGLLLGAAAIAFSPVIFLAGVWIYCRLEDRWYLYKWRREKRLNEEQKSRSRN